MNGRHTFDNSQPRPLVGVLHVICAVVVVREDFAGHPGAVLEPGNQIARQCLHEIVHRKTHCLLLLSLLRQRLALWRRARQLQGVDFGSNLLEESKVLRDSVKVAPLDAHSALRHARHSTRLRRLIENVNHEDIVRTIFKRIATQTPKIENSGHCGFVLPKTMTV